MTAQKSYSANRHTHTHTHMYRQPLKVERNACCTLSLVWRMQNRTRENCSLQWDMFLSRSCECMFEKYVTLIEFEWSNNKKSITLYRSICGVCVSRCFLLLLLAPTTPHANARLPQCTSSSAPRPPLSHSCVGRGAWLTRIAPAPQPRCARCTPHEDALPTN